MQVITDRDGFRPPPRGSAVTIGAYDGVHLGHRAVIEQLHTIAAERDLATAVVTFDRHPAQVVRPESAPRLLTDLDQKLELLERTGVDITLVLSFDEAASRESAEDFVTTILADTLAARTVAVGADFHFGHGRRGNVELLTAMGSELGFDVVGLALRTGPGAPVDGSISSTAVRRALVDGRLDDATAMLGRPHEVRGVVEHGDERGRELGFPTANVAVPAEILLPADGIYAGWYHRSDGSRHGTAISLGRRPTFYEAADLSLLEAHLLDFSGDLYDEPARVEFVERLRGEIRFDSVDDLVAQIADDCAQAAAILG